MTVFRFLNDMMSWSTCRIAPVCVGLLLASCTSAPLPPSNNPVSAAPLALETSVISIPVSVDLARLSDDLLRQLPKPILSGSQKRSLPVRFNAMHTSYALEPGTCSVTELSCLTRNSVKTVATDVMASTEAVVTQQMYVRDLSMSMEGSQFSATAEIEFTVNTRFKPPATPVGTTDCGEGREKPRFELMLGGHVSWSPEGDIVISPRPYYVRWLQPCNITAFQPNMESLLNLPALRDKLQAALEENVFSRLRQDSLRMHLERAWTELHMPREIRPGVWLLPRPERVAFADLEGKGNHISTGILVYAYPEVVKGARPEIIVPPVPAPERGISSSGGMHMAIRGDMALGEAQKLLSRSLAGQVVRLGGGKVKIRSARLFGHEDKAVLGLTLRRPEVADIYLLGRPVYDLERNQVRFEDLEFSPETRDYLRETAGWLLDEGLLAAVQGQAAFNFDETMAGALREFQDLRVEAGQDMTLRAGVQRMQPQSLHFTRESLVAYVLLEGRLALESRQKN